MQHSISFTIPGEPVAFARSGGNGTVRFTPKKQRDFMALVRLSAYQAMDGMPPFEGPLFMEVTAQYLVPKSWPKAKAADAFWRVSKPDVDNIAKLVADSLNEVVYQDDAQVSRLIVQKNYSDVAGVSVRIASLEATQCLSAHQTSL